MTLTESPLELRNEFVLAESRVVRRSLVRVPKMAVAWPAAAILTVLVLAACESDPAVGWTNPRASAQQRAQDVRGCTVVRREAGWKGFQRRTVYLEIRTVDRLCLENLGYRAPR